MDKKLFVNFLWHMHQPYYRDDVSGEVVMPWVFLHAIKDYYDMPWYLDKFSTVKATFNLVPSLLIQLEAYTDEEINDRFLKIIRKEVFALSHEEKTYLIEYLFFSNVHKMIKPLPRYYALYQKKESFDSYEEMAKHFLEDELLDLEVLFLLAWCGNYLRENNSVVKTLLEKGSTYTQEDKLLLLKSLSHFIQEIIPYYRKLMDDGKIVVSTTPFNHPISPLLFDIKNGQYANSYTTLPDVDTDQSFKEDALVQIGSAFEYYEKLFGRSPVGFWPAEGSVSYDFLKVLSQKGVRWACSDEEVLYKSGAFSKEDIYKNNLLHFDGHEIHLFFRDKALSDLIGFSYSGWDDARAVDDLFSRLEEIYHQSDSNQNVNIILDGENAWEHYDDNAMGFFMKLYERLESTPWCQSAFFGDVIDDDTITTNHLESLQPGSWISGNFNIWIGHEEKNRAWELLYLTKSDFDKVKPSLSSDTLLKIQQEFLVAQSSDWFWWYGDDHHTDLATTFDRLFRTHLINIYTLMGQKIPHTLFEPIVETTQNNHTFLKKSSHKITATIDGKKSNFFEWHGASELDLENELSSMSMDDFTISKILYGCDEKYCYLALEGNMEELINRASLEIEIDEKTYFSVDIKDSVTQYTDGITCMGDEIIEIKIDKTLVEGKGVQLKLFREGKLLQLLPLYTPIEFQCLTKMKENWYI